MIPPPLEIPHAAGTSRIDFVRDAVADPSAAVEGIPRGSRLFLLTDDRVAPLWGDPVEAALRSTGREVVRFVLPSGEEAKTLATVAEALSGVLDAGIRRDDRVMALGGGVLGDEAGLVAALALRGVPVRQLPTTLLAMVDSSVGGKTGVNHPTGKNRIGAFHQPERVVVSPVFLSTLPSRELGAGRVEALKGALLAGEPEVARAAEVLAGRGDLLDLVADALRLKARIVAADEREERERVVLNLGHTIGHALEGATGYARFRHGEAVGWGLLAVLELSASLGLLPRGDAERFARLVDAAAERPPVDDLPYERLVPFLAADKKSRSADGLRWVLLAAAGRPEVVVGVPEERVSAAWESVRRRGPSR